MKKIIISEKDGFILTGENGVTERKCGFTERYRETAAEIARSSEWKRSGSGAAFMQTGPSRPLPDNFDSEISGVALRGDTFYYSATIERSSGVVSASAIDPKQTEGNVVHGADCEYGDIDVSPDGKSLLTSIKNDPFASSLVIFSLGESGESRTLTGGDSRDEHPSFSLFDRNKILFSTAGIGRDYNGDFVRYSNSSIASYDLSSREITEVLSDEKHSLIHPRDDKNGNLYYIERPTSEKLKKPNVFLEILLIPFRIIYAIYKFLEAFTRIFTGKGFITKTDGENPAKQKSERDVVIDGYKIQAEKNLKSNTKRKEKFAGIAPRDWVLKKRDRAGESTTIARGVIAYDIAHDGTIVYTNGRSVIVIDSDGNETEVTKAKLMLKVALDKPVAELPGNPDFFV